MLEPPMRTALLALTAGVGARQTGAARQAAVEVYRASLDFKLRHRPRAEIDLALLDNWTRQLVVDLAAGNKAGALGDVASLKWIRDRLARDLTESELRDIDTALSRLQTAAQTANAAAGGAAAAQLRAALSRVEGSPGRTRA